MPHVTVVGDLILDRYFIGDATRLNPEQPGVVIRVDKEEDRLGGAAAVAMLSAGFGARVTLARDVGVPTLVDPARSRCWSDYGQVTLMKANWVEAKEAARVRNARPLALARSLADRHGCHVVITLGGHGMVCAEREGGTWYLPAERVEVRDVCGAGDTVLAAIGASMLSGESLREACRYATVAAGRQVVALGITLMGEITSV
jgi:bifunctional ADP-heptose synthase (sugar kinase/adenylyltransferase)